MMKNMKMTHSSDNIMKKKLAHKKKLHHKEPVFSKRDTYDEDDQEDIELGHRVMKYGSNC